MGVFCDWKCSAQIYKSACNPQAPTHDVYDRIEVTEYLYTIGWPDQRGGAVRDGVLAGKV